MEKRKYFCCDNLSNYDPWPWKHLLREVIPKSKYVEFNQLFLNQEIPGELIWMEQFRVKDVSENKIHKAGPLHRFQLASPIQDFIMNKEYESWRNFYYEDLSFFAADGTELMATVSHENYVIKLMTENEQKELKEKGIDFWCDWGTLEEQKGKSKSKDRKSTFKNMMGMLWAMFG